MPLNVFILYSTQLSEATGVIAIINTEVRFLSARYVALSKYHMYSQPLGISSNPTYSNQIPHLLPLQKFICIFYCAFTVIVQRFSSSLAELQLIQSS